MAEAEGTAEGTAATPTVQSIADGARVDGIDDQGRTALIQAAAGGHVDVVEVLLGTARTALNARCHDGCTALGYAVSAGHTTVVHRLLAAGADPTNVNERGDTALICSIRHEQRPIIDVLLATATTTSVNSVNDDSESALTVACYQNRPDVVEKLIQAGANVCHEDGDGDTGLGIATVHEFDRVVQVLFASRVHRPDDANRSRALTDAVTYGYVGVAQILVAAGADVNHQATNGFRPLIVAAQFGRAELVQLFLRAGANVNVANHRGDTALTLAAWKGFPAIVEMVLAVDGIAIEHTDADGNTALLRAADEHHVDSVHMLIAVGANVHHVNNDGETALIRAGRKGQLELVDTLLGLGVAVDCATRLGWTALLFASQCGSVAVVETLLSTGRARVNHANDMDDSALLLAARCGHLRVVDMLLAHGALVDHPGVGGGTAVETASMNGHADVAAVLLAAGADTNTTNHQGVLPLLRAIENGHEHVVAVLLANGVDANPTNVQFPLMLVLRRRPAMIECIRASNTVDLDHWRSMLLMT